MLSWALPMSENSNPDLTLLKAAMEAYLRGEIRTRTLMVLAAMQDSEAKAIALVMRALPE